MSVKRYILSCVALLLLVTAKAVAQQDPGYTERAKKYVEQYSPLAIAEQRRSGIPASITLGQGILETEAGISELMTEANNHFGIKCKNGWLGETFTHTDDAPDECFKKYKCAEDSYKDHSDHLIRNQRYSPLFKISQTDYASWAVCLKKCGYATNPQYAQKLIKIIEDFKLQEYTYSAMDSSLVSNYHANPIANNYNADPVASADLMVNAVPEPDTTKKPVVVADTIAETKREADVSSMKSMADSARNVVMHPVEEPVIDSNDIVDTNYDKSRVITVNGLRAFYGNKNEMMLQYAVKYHLRYPKLLEMNDLPDAPLPFGMNIYLEKKLTVGTHPDHIVKPGENLLKIAQIEGMQLKRLMTLNLLNPNEEPAVGDTLQLQTQALQKPLVKTSEIAAHKKNAIVSSEENTTGQGGDYIAIKKQKPVHTDTPKHHATARTPVAKPLPPKILPSKLAPTPITETVAVAVASNPEALGEDPVSKQDEELASLKAELDKVVYADDSKLIAQNPAPVPVVEKKPVTDAPESTGADKYYTVKKGDTAFSIAKKHNVSLDDLKKWNDLGSGGVKVGQTLLIKE